MKTLLTRLWTDQGAAIGVLAAAVQLAVFLPDWRAGLTAALTVLSGAAGGVKRP